MIKKITIKNFMKHENLELELLPGLNVITGETDAGKSAIIHALFWLFNNRPFGEKFIRNHDSKLTVSVKVEYEDGQWVERRRNLKENCYIVNGEKYKALRGAIPKEVRQLIRMGEENFQNQHQRYFLIDQNPGHIAQEINKITNLDLIDKVTNKVKLKLLQIRTKIKAVDSEQEELKEEIKSLGWVEEADKLVQEIKALNISELDLKIRKKEILLAADNFSELDYEEKEIKIKLSLLKNLKTALRKAQIMKAKKASILELVRREKELPLLPPITWLKKNQEKLQQARKQLAEYDKLKSLLEQYKELQLKEEVLETNLSDAKERLNRFIKKLGFCPTCGRSNKK